MYIAEADDLAGPVVVVIELMFPCVGLSSARTFPEAIGDLGMILPERYLKHGPGVCARQLKHLGDVIHVH